MYVVIVKNILAVVCLCISELIEAAMYLYQATGDPYLLQIGVDMLESIEHDTRTKCGYATVRHHHNCFVPYELKYALPKI